MDELRIGMTDLQSQLGHLVVAARALLERTFALSMACCVHGKNSNPVTMIQFPRDSKARRHFAKSCPKQCVELLSLLGDKKIQDVYSQLVDIGNCCKHGSVKQPRAGDWVQLVRQPDHPVDDVVYFLLSPNKGKGTTPGPSRWISGSALLERSLNLIERLMRVAEAEIYAPRIAAPMPPANDDELGEPLSDVHPLDRIVVDVRFSYPPTAAEVLARASNQVGVPVQYLKLASLDTKLEGEQVIDESGVRNNIFLFLFETREPDIVSSAPQAISEVRVMLDPPWWRNLWAYLKSLLVK
jgi:hypothetical protein